MKIISSIGALLMGLVIGYFIFHNEDSNSRLMYGESGLPKNCRAIIKANIDEYKNGQYTAEDIIDSLDRNCGEFGYSRDIEK